MKHWTFFYANLYRKLYFILVFIRSAHFLLALFEHAFLEKLSRLVKL